MGRLLFHRVVRLSTAELSMQGHVQWAVEHGRAETMVRVGVRSPQIDAQVIHEAVEQSTSRLQRGSSREVNRRGQGSCGSSGGCLASLQRPQRALAVLGQQSGHDLA